MNLSDSTSEISSHAIDSLSNGELILYQGHDLLHIVLSPCLSNSSIDKIGSFLISRVFISILVLTGFTFAASSFFSGIVSMIALSLFVIEALLMLLIFDRRILLLQVKSFDTLYKLYNVNLLMFIFCFEATIKATISWIYIIIAWFTINVYTVAVSSADAVNVTYRTKQIVLTFAALFWIVQYFAYYILSVKYFKEVSWSIASQTISTRAIMLGCLLNMIIFSLKQLFYVIFWPSHAAVLSIGPKLIWKQKQPN